MEPTTVAEAYQGDPCPASEGMSELSLGRVDDLFREGTTTVIFRWVLYIIALVFLDMGAVLIATSYPVQQQLKIMKVSCETGKKKNKACTCKLEFE